jgi:uncharacterized protein (DUF433 family)
LNERLGDGAKEKAMTLKEIVLVGTRVPVRILLDYLEGGEPLEEFLDNYPTVPREQAVAFLEEAGRAVLAQIA